MKEKVMKVIHGTTARKHIWNGLALVGIFAATVPTANAKHRAVKAAEQPATVVAKVALAGAPASQIFFQEIGGKQYLYIGGNSKEGFTLVDVTNPAKPGIIQRVAWPKEASTGRLQMVGGGLALVEGPDSGSLKAEPPAPTRTVKVLDLSEPTNPRVVLSFSGVTDTLQDGARNLVYITNGEELWILRNNQPLTTAAEPRACTSDDAYSDVASCQ
jgi:LVIVD repeat-containing protein